MGTLLQDLRYGRRILAKNPGFTSVAVITLALGIGANSAIFSVVNAVLLRPVHFEDPDRIVRVWATNPRVDSERALPSPADFLDWRDRNHVFEQISAWRTWFYTLIGGKEPEQVWGVRTSTSFFEILRVKAALGRTFLPEEEEPGRDQVVVLSHGIWERRFGADRSLVGKTIDISGKPFTVIGVLPADFNLFGSTRPLDLWMPFVLQPEQLRRDDRSIIVFARLKAGVTLNDARAEMSTIARQLEAEYPKTNRGWGANVETMHESLVVELRPGLRILLAAVGFVLLIACANVANLLLARGTARQREFAIRGALGAGPLRLVRHLLTESVLTAILGGGLGLLFSFWALDLLRSISPGEGVGWIPHLDRIRVDRSVLGFTLLVSLLTTVLFGLAPALQVSKAKLNESLKEGGRSYTEGLQGRRLRDLLVMSEVALALVLLVGAGLMVRSFLKLLQVNPGLDPQGVLTTQVWLPESKYPESRQVAAFYDQALRRIEVLPGVLSASAINFFFLGGWGDSVAFAIEGRVEPPPGEELVADYRVIAPNYFRAMKIPLVRGRHLTEGDREGTPGVVVINETMARRFWPHEDIIGKQIRLKFPGAKAPWRPEASPSWLTIVGMVGDVRDAGRDPEVVPEVYMSYRQSPSHFMRLVVRTSPEPMSMASAVRHELLALDKDQPVMDIKTVEQFISESSFRRRFDTVLLGIFAALALLMSGVGIFGVISYSISQGKHEIGVRMALGAKPRDVLRLVVRQGMILTLIGVLAGLAGAVAVTRVLSSLLYGVRPTDPLTYAGVSLLLASVAFLASYVPARRATKVDPFVALRCE